MNSVILECPSFTYIDETELPADFEKILMEGFSRLSKYYHSSIMSDPVSNLAHSSVNAIIRKLILGHNLERVLDVGVGDGLRLKAIATEQNILYGVETSLEMISEAEHNGIEVAKHDFKMGLPYADSSMGMVLFLSNGFGYLMDNDPLRAEELRINILNEAYRILKPRGFLFMELMSNDTESQADGKVCQYERELKVDGQTQFRGTFYLKEFSFRELVRLIDSSDFDQDSLDIKYVLLRDFKQRDNTEGIGKIIRSFRANDAFDISQFQPTNPKGGYETRYDYLVLISVMK